MPHHRKQIHGQNRKWQVFINPFQTNLHFYIPGKDHKTKFSGKRLAMLSLISDASADVQNLIPWVPFAVCCPSFTWMPPYEKAQNHELSDSFANLFQMFYLQCRGFNSYFDCSVLSNILYLPNP